MKMKLKVGQEVFLKPINNRARYGYNKIKKATIAKIGRKYFYLNEFPRKKYRIEDLGEESEYAPDWEIYFSKQAILDKKESDDLFVEIKNKFESWNRNNYSLDQLRRIKSIIKESE